MAKARGTKLPKEVAGVKIPKKLRKAGSAAMDLAQQPIVGELVAAALTAAAASLMKDTKAGKAVRREASDAASETVREASAIGTAVKQVLLDAAREMLDSFEDAKPEKVLAKSRPRKPGRGKKA
jgi:erythromycin esterase-like protein